MSVSDMPNIDIRQDDLVNLPPLALEKGTIWESVGLNETKKWNYNRVKQNKTLYKHFTYLCIHPKDGSISCIDEFGILSFLSQTGCNVLSNAHNSNHITLLISSRCGVQKYLNPGTPFRNQGELEIISLVSRKSLVEDSLHGSLEIIRDELLYERPPHDLFSAVSNQTHRTLHVPEAIIKGG